MGWGLVWLGLSLVADDMERGEEVSVRTRKDTG